MHHIPLTDKFTQRLLIYWFDGCDAIFNIHIYRKKDKQVFTGRDIQKDRKTDRQTNRQKDKQADRQAEIKTDR